MAGDDVDIPAVVFKAVRRKRESTKYAQNHALVV